MLLWIVLTDIRSHLIESFGETEGLLKFINEGSKFFEEEPPDTNPVFAEYDFIIVGAGSAGCALANRLSQVEHTAGRSWKTGELRHGHTSTHQHVSNYRSQLEFRIRIVRQCLSWYGI
ncbi:hypothetical protein L9F63_003085 [Diploptera punctata]|uniref:Glucose-methanol-choline oxidoreductase N-terminal domain-containing protein n=1 Tax=Diploptera punctata TaxID=6984 RepID=A0AAD8ECD7_DIPPU|nr:hypothetical protein L9F63_003085 [Diploptera punctata]